MSEANHIVSRRGIGGLLMRGALARLQMAVAASLVLWACVTVGELVPPDTAQSGRASAAVAAGAAAGRRRPGNRRRSAASSTGSTWSRNPIVAPVNANGQVAFYATILRSKATEGIFISSGGHFVKVAAVGDTCQEAAGFRAFASHPMPSLNDFRHGRFCSRDLCPGR